MRRALERPMMAVSISEHSSSEGRIQIWWRCGGEAAREGPGSANGVKSGAAAAAPSPQNWSNNLLRNSPGLRLPPRWLPSLHSPLCRPNGAAVLPQRLTPWEHLNLCIDITQFEVNGRANLRNVYRRTTSGLPLREDRAARARVRGEPETGCSRAPCQWWSRGRGRGRR